MSQQLKLLNHNSEKCINNVLECCNGSYRCETGVAVGLNEQGLNQANRICKNFHGVETCLPEQTCINIRGSTYKSCHKTVECLRNSNEK
jgi:hypothetical protein